MLRSIILGLFMSLSLAPLAPAAEKPIQLHPDNPHYFLWRGKPTVLITSTEHYGAVLNLDFDFVRYLDELQSKGLNHTRTFSGTYREIPGSFGITDNTLGPKRYQSPWLLKDGKYDLTQFDPAYFDRLKSFLSEASKRGICVEFSLFCPFYEEGLWTANPMNPANNLNNLPTISRNEVYTLKHKEYVAVHDAFVRKVVPEINGFDNFYFEIANEPYFGGIMEDWQAHIAQTIVEAEKDLPNKHLIAQNIANGGKKIDKPDPNVSIFNFHYAAPPDTVEQNYKLNKALGDDETGFRGKEDVLYRSEAWEFIIAGGAEYANLDYSFTPNHADGSLADYTSPGGGSANLRTQLSILKKFMDDMDFIHMAPANKVIRSGQITGAIAPAKNPSPAKFAAFVRCLAKPGDTYALYILGGSAATLQLDVPPGKYKADWINTKTGQIDKTQTVEHAQGNLTLTSPPYSDDIALRVQAMAR
jgi:hypothetical protein